LGSSTQRNLQREQPQFLSLGKKGSLLDPHLDLRRSSEHGQTKSPRVDHLNLPNQVLSFYNDRSKATAPMTPLTNQLGETAAQRTCQNSLFDDKTVFTYLPIDQTLKSPGTQSRNVAISVRTSIPSQQTRNTTTAQVSQLQSFDGDRGGRDSKKKTETPALWQERTSQAKTSLFLKKVESKHAASAQLAQESNQSSAAAFSQRSSGRKRISKRQSTQKESPHRSTQESGNRVPDYLQILRDKGKIQADRALQEAKEQRYKDFMHRLKVAFSGWIQKKLNEESYEHKVLEMHIKDVMARRESKA